MERAGDCRLRRGIIQSDENVTGREGREAERQRLDQSSGFASPRAGLAGLNSLLLSSEGV